MGEGREAVSRQSERFPRTSTHSLHPLALVSAATPAPEDTGLSDVYVSARQGPCGREPQGAQVCIRRLKEDPGHFVTN